MAPTRVSKARYREAKVSAQYEGSEDGASQQGSQSSGDDNKVLEMTKKMRRDARSRREQRRLSIDKSHEESMMKIEEAMKLKLDELSRRMTQRHKLRMERLYDVLRRRAAIEESMLATSKKLEAAFSIAEKALAHALEHRLQEMRSSRVPE